MEPTQQVIQIVYNFEFSWFGIDVYDLYAFIKKFNLASQGLYFRTLCCSAVRM
jgi:hypothetical protein